MKITWLIMLGILLAHGSYAACDIPTPLAPATATQAVLLTDAEAKYCASGFLVDESTIVSTLHFARNVCAAGASTPCLGLHVHRAVAVGSRATRRVEGSYSLVFQSALLDVSIFSSSPETFSLASLLDTLAHDPSAHDEGSLRMYGFPGCSMLTARTLNLTSETPIHLYLEGEARPGSSGSIISTRDGAPIALLTQAEPQQLQNLFVRFGRAPIGLKATTLEALRFYLDLEASEQEVARHLLDVHQNRLRIEGSGIKRLLSSLEWQDMLLRFDQDRIEHLSQASLPVFPASRPLLIADNEQTSPLRELRALSLSERFEGDERFAGSQRAAASLILTFVLFAILLSALWASSVTWFVLSSPRSGMARGLEALLAAVLFWPFGLLLLLWLRRSSQK